MPRYPQPFHVLILLASMLTGVLGATQVNAQSTLSGRVIDSETGEYVFGASVVDMETGLGTTTNVYGFFSLTLDAGPHDILWTFIGYKSNQVHFDAINDAQVAQNDQRIIELTPWTVQIAEAEVRGERSEHVDDTQMGRAKVDMSTIKALPALLGEVDILKVIQLLPGVQSAGEGNAGFYVRGGGPDQNLVLVDNAVVYNAAHLFGFFSVFNPDAISGVELTKGGMPARYGGRVSAVLEISLKEGNARKLETSGGIGLISSRLTVEGPIVKDTASFIVSARRTYIDLLLKAATDPSSALAGSGYYFYDLNTKMNWRISPKDQLYVSGYFGRDVFSFANSTADFSTRIPWGNATGTVRWNHLFNDRAFLSTTATLSDYDFAFEAKQDSFLFGFRSGINDLSIKPQLTLYPNPRHTIRAGIDYTFHSFIPTEVYAENNGEAFDLGEAEQTFSHEIALYAEDEFDVSDRIRISAGLRYGGFAHVGPFTRYTLDTEENPLGGAAQMSETRYDNGELVAWHDGMEPRLGIRVKTGPKSSIKAGYSRNQQFVHLTSLAPTSMPADIWLPSSDRVEPQRGSQWATGYFTQWGENQMWEGSIEAYYKTLENLVAYADGSEPEDNIQNNVDNNLVFGEGTSYGAEFFLKKRQGVVTGWIGYTWSKTDRLFADLNNGRPFPARFDRRHDLSVVAQYTLNDRWDLSATFVYGTGNAITVPVQRYFLDGQIVNVYGDRNGFRMAPYHRADIGATYTPRNKAGKPRAGQWVFSIYNLYNRKNPYFIYFGSEGSISTNDLSIKAYQVSLFPILPSVAWNFSF
jgi:hypothetical protein